MQEPKTFSIFFYEGYIDVSPTIINIASFLREHNYRVNLYTRFNPSCRKVQDLGDGIKIIYIKSPETIPVLSTVISWLTKAKRTNLSSFLDFCGWAFILSLSRFFRQKIKSENNEFINIGVDVYGSGVAFLEYIFFNTKYVYLSLELNEPTTLVPKFLNLIDQVVYKNSICLLIQDEDRFQSISRFNCYQHPNVFYLPNSPVMQLGKTIDKIGNNFFREKLEIDSKAFPCLILQAGAISDECFSLMLAQAFSKIELSRGYALIFHERFKRTVEDAYIQRLMQVNSNNLFLSLEPLPYGEISRVFESATIGLAFYKNQGDNFSKIALASGKLAGYLKYGKPVLVNKLKSLENLVNKYGIGVVIEDPSDPLEIKTAIELILNNYGLYEANARKCFEAEFNFEIKAELFLEFITQPLDSYD